AWTHRKAAAEMARKRTGPRLGGGFVGFVLGVFVGFWVVGLVVGWGFVVVFLFGWGGGGWFLGCFGGLVVLGCVCVGCCVWGVWFVCVGLVVLVGWGLVWWGVFVVGLLLGVVGGGFGSVVGLVLGVVGVGLGVGCGVGLVGWVLVVDGFGLWGIVWGLEGGFVSWRDLWVLVVGGGCLGCVVWVVVLWGVCGVVLLVVVGWCVGCLLVVLWVLWWFWVGWAGGWCHWTVGCGLGFGGGDCVGLVFGWGDVSD
ncbi:hypothetical protein, partial [Pseudomonas syringae group genomosp. 7]|uniref:hypothetical protein n=1 Tax=Pseudomonas syringae group genomosp. 7 TaxID=251699 RepID=UPI0037702338